MKQLMQLLLPKLLALAWSLLLHVAAIGIAIGTVIHMARIRRLSALTVHGPAFTTNDPALYAFDIKGKDHFIR